MKNIFSALLLVVVLLLGACKPASPVTPTLTPIPPKEPTQNNTPLPVTPVESAFAPENSTAAPTEEIIASRTVTFETPDGATINGELYRIG